MAKSILLLSEIYPPESGGSGRWFSEVYPRIQTHDCYCLVGNHTRATPHDKCSEAAGIIRRNLNIEDRAPLSYKSMKRYFEIAKTTRKIAKSMAARQIHAARPLHEGLVCRAVAVSLRLPYLCYVHGEDISIASTSRELKVTTSLALGGASVIIANSKFTQQMLTNDWQIDSARIQVIHPGVDTNFFQPQAISVATRETLGWGNRPVVLTVGRLQRRKGHDKFIRAIPSIKEQIPTFLYAVVGSGPMLTELQQIAKECNVVENVIFHGEVSDEKILKCYQQCDLFCLPNRTDGADVEGFGMVSLEAQACGKPALVGHSGGTPETVIDGATGLVIDCTQPDLIATKAIELLTAPNMLSQFGKDARIRAVEQFDWAAIVRRSERLFHDIDKSR